ncbi:hypothetical protein MKEN_00724100 [Mycena kentingensis (nom. inval.)]|nr:hypothetical protein MKEN_00724100 [Mycena kentingensis (nom. inval.)]
MARIPQELINAIIDETVDVPTLKSCALASSRTREPSQRRLFKIAPLLLGHPGYRNAMETSPHLAAYTEVVVIQGRARWSDWGQVGHSEDEILSQLSNVRTCVLDFSRPGAYSYQWARIQPAIQSVILSFLRRQRPLDEIHTVNADMGVLELVEILASARARRISLDGLFLRRSRDGELENPLIGKNVPSPPFLALPCDAPGALELLARSNFFRRTLHLSITLQLRRFKLRDIFGQILKFASESGKLQQLTLIADGPSDSELTTMDLPDIEYLHFIVQQSSKDWAFLAITTLLQRGPTTPSLRRITFTSWATPGQSIASQRSEHILPQRDGQKTFKNLDTALASRAPLQLLFRIDGPADIVHAAEREITGNMPLSAALGLIKVEAYCPPAVVLYRSWKAPYYDPWAYI